MSWIDPLDALPPPPPARPRPVLRALAAGVALLLVAGPVMVVLRGTTDGGIDHPEAWDPRVAELAAFVEGARDLDFDHPVHVDFLSPEEYRAEATAEESDLSEDELDDLALEGGLLRALGVASGPVDLFDALNTVVDGGTLAFYDPEDRRIRVRGTALTVGLRVTLVHELVHALQDQAFDLGRLNDEDLTYDEASALRALVEGDALRVEEAYISDELDADEQAAYEAEWDREVVASETATEDVPPFLLAAFASHYLLGGPFVQMLVNQGGNAAVDAALEDPPTTAEHLFDPASHLAGEETVALDLDGPVDADNADDVEEAPFGATTWFLVLAERLDPLVAFDATLGWGGDTSFTFERDGQACVRAAFTGDTDRDTDEMADALDAWAAAMPEGAVARLDAPDHTGFESCDPGPDVDLEAAGRGTEVLALPNLWGYLVADAAAAADAETARCYARRVIDQLTYEEITDPQGAAFTTAAFQQATQDAFLACR